MTVTAYDARLATGNAIDARLKALPTEPGWPTLTVFDGEVPASPPILETAAGPDPFGRIAPYAVVYPSPGSRPNPNLEGTSPAGAGDFLWSGQINFAAGYRANLLDVLDRAIPWLETWVVEIDGLQCGRFRQNPNSVPGLIRRNDAAKPPRFYVPTLWQLHVATAPA